MHSFFTIAVIVFAGFSGLMTFPLFIRLQWPTPLLWFIKLYASALSPVFACMGVFVAISGFATGSVLIASIGVYISLIFFMHIRRTTRRPEFSSGFEQAFGPGWQDSISAGQKARLLPRRTTLLLHSDVNPILQQNIVFAKVPGTDRELLCDIWQPRENVPSSGLAFIYMHGSAWYMLDKDAGTRPFFRHLVAQGHVVMDVAYRLAPETDMMGMIHDVKRAIVWMRENADAYRVNPHCIVVGGGSAGAYLALMAAYTIAEPGFVPGELAGKDVSVCAVISLYGPTDLKAMYYHTNQQLTTVPGAGGAKRPVPQLPRWMIRMLGKNYHRLGMDKDLAAVGTFAPLLGGHPNEVPAAYAFYSPVSYVHPGCPPTLLLQGEDDVMAPVKSTRTLYALLLKEKVPAIMHILPQTDHGFDLVLPKISPSAHNALYDMDWFLAYIAGCYDDDFQEAAGSLIFSRL